MRSILKCIPTPSVEQKQTEDAVRQLMYGELLNEIMTMRANAAVAKGTAKYKTMIPSVADIYYTARVFRLVAVPNKDDMWGATQGILEDYERLVRYGVSDEEIDDAKETRKAVIVKNMKKVVKAANKDYVNSAVETFTRNWALCEPATNYATMIKVLDKIKADDLNAYIKKYLAIQAVTPGYKNETIIFAGNPEVTKNIPAKGVIYDFVDSLQKS